ncbi:adipose-secreted signaling protein homolog [Eupeodes corollae]|uniref:adipose-secreted signaling protein homolog n=1 Tax=Eupeodes corollae TaxID=290404 RepID=UPI0024911DE7|nr:adipose-secreted signaling protein homolog [Eupeodes corollae]
MAQGGTAAVDLAGAAAVVDRAGAAADHPHVHFDTASLKEDFESDSSVTYKRSGDTIVVSLGFLQINHRYSIDLKLPATVFGQIDCLTLSQFVPEVSTVPNLNCRITEFSGVKDDQHDFFDMKIEFFAYKEKLLRETLTIQNSKNSEEIFKLLIAARVLGKGKGTPMLRTGIHCIGSEKDDDESEASDFSGFGKGKLK